VTAPTRSLRRRRHRPSRRGRAALGAWWSLAAVAAVLGLGSFAIADVGAQKDDEDTGSAVVVDHVDARGEDVTVDGSVTGGDPASVEVTAAGDPVEVSSVDVVGDGVRNEVVAVLDNAKSLGNGTVQLAKQSLEPLMPGDGPVSTLGIVTTGGSATVEVGPTASVGRIEQGLGEIDPVGASATWDGLTRAAELLEDRPEGSVGTILVIAASPPVGNAGAASRANSAMQRAGVRLDVVAMERGTDLGLLSTMVEDLGGSVQVVASDEDLAGAVDDVATSLAGRFSATFAAPEGVDGMVAMTVTAGDAATELAYSSGADRTGSAALAPLTDAGGGGLLTSPVMKWLIVLMGAVAAGLLVWAVASLVMPRSTDLTSRLEVYDESFGAEPDPDAVDDSAVTVPIIQRAVDFTGDLAERRGVLDKVEGMLERANLPLRAPEAMFFTAVLALVLVVLSFFLTGNVLIALVVAVVAAILPSAVLNFKIRRRQKAFVAQLPDMLTLLAGTLKAGYSIGQGFESVSTEVDDPMGRELRRVVSETRLGRSLEESLEAVAQRLDSDDFGWAVMAIKIQREVGGNLAELLLTVADTMTQRERLRREVSTLTAEGRISAIIIGALPPVLAAVMFVLNPDYIKELFSPGLGYMLIGAALVMMAIGFAWMKKCITIEV
jgi:tight adherence protein B